MDEQEQKEKLRARLLVCLSNELWVLSNLMWIKPKSGPVSKFHPRDEQIELFRALWYRNAILKARQLGFSTLVCLFIFARCILKRDFTAAIIDKKIDDAKKKLAIIRRAWTHLNDPRDELCKWAGGLIKAGVKLITDSKTELAWDNGSSVYVDNSIRGGALQLLHVSELAAVSVKFPGRAEEIMAGGIPALDPSCIVISESTHEGGPFGVHYTLIKQAMDMIGRELSPLDWRFHWFPWHVSKEYRMKTGEIEGALLPYFAELGKLGISLDSDQQRFYSAQWRTLKHRVKTEYPSTPDEALSAVSSGSIYGDIIATLRLNGRVCDYEAEHNLPAFCFWDIGQSDSTAIWLMQFAAREKLVIDWHEDSGKAAGTYAKVVRQWEDEHNVSVAMHFLPHDADQRDKAGGLTWADHLRKAGIHRITVVPRTPDLWTGINALRDQLPSFRFHTRTAKAREKDGATYPSGLACLELYRREVEIDSGRIKEMPVHDFTSHTCDAMRTFAEAWDRGMVQSLLSTGTVNKPNERPGVKVVMGFAQQRGAEDEDKEFWKNFEP